MKYISSDFFIKTFILIGFAVWIGYLLLSGNINLYLSPDLTWLSKLASIFLLVLISAMLMPSKHALKHYQGYPHTPIAGGHSHSPLSITKIIIFCFPLLLGFTVKPQILDSATLSNSINTAGTHPFYTAQFSKSDWQSLLGGINNLVSDKFSFSTSHKVKNTNTVPAAKTVNPTVSNPENTDLLQLALSDHPDTIYNHSYKLIGFVYKDPRLAQNQFVIARFVITCCIVDAQPIGIIAESSDAHNIKENTWIEVDGILKKRVIANSNKIQPVYNFQIAENTAPYLLVTQWKTIPAPNNPYLTAPQ